MEASDLRRRFVRLTRRLNEVRGCLRAVNKLAGAALEKSDFRKCDTICDKLEQRLESARDDIADFYGMVFDKRTKVKPSWERWGEAAERIAWTVVQESSGPGDSKTSGEWQASLKRALERILLYADVCKPIRILNSGGENNCAKTIHKTSEFANWLERAAGEVNPQNILSRVGKNTVPLIPRELTLPDSRPRGAAPGGATGTVDSIDASLLVPTRVFKCDRCGRKLLLLGRGDAAPMCPARGKKT